jgi:hypothetical protein
MAGRADGVTRSGLIGRDGSSCGQQGRLTLMATSRTPNAQPKLRAPKLSVKVRDHLASRSRARGPNRRPRLTLIEVGLTVLVVSTVWAIASVSVWWVPGYLVLLATIFVTPRVRPSSSSASDSSAVSNGIGTADLGPGLRVDRADGAEQYRPVARSDADLTTDSAESSDSSVDPNGAVIAKPRRSRVRARKVSKPATEPVADSLVAWIQVGPGKFVRSEGGITAADSAQTEEVTARDVPATETPTVLALAVAAESEPLAVQEPLGLLETSPCDTGPVLVSADHALVSVTEEYGIAPSAFSLIPEPSSANESLDCDLSDRIDQPEIKTTVPTSPAGQLLPSSGDEGRLWLQSGTSRLWVSRVQRGIIHVVPRMDRASCRREIRTGRNPRTLVKSWFAPNTPRQHAARRAFGRMAHVQRTLQPRSPPGYYG